MGKVNRKLVALGVSQRLAPFNGSFAVANHLVSNRHMSLERVDARIRTAESAGLIRRGESKGLAYLGMTEPMFAEKIRAVQAGLTLKQRNAFSFLRKLMVPEEMALRMCKTQVASRELFLKRAKAIASIELDPKKYGVKRVPLRLFWRVMDLPPTKMRRYIEARILADLENTHSRKVLDGVFPLWGKVRQIAKMEPRTILAKVEWLITNGVSLHGRYIRQYSLEQLEQVKGQLQKMAPEEQRTMKQRLTQARKA